MQKPNKFVVSSFFVFFFCLGTALTCILGWLTYKTIIFHTWTKTPCTIISSQLIEENNKPLKIQLSYRHEKDGKEFVSSQYASEINANGDRFSDYTTAIKLVEQFKPDTETICYVNSKNPGQSFIKKPGLWIALFLPIPLIFVMIGAGGFYKIKRWDPSRETILIQEGDTLKKITFIKKKSSGLILSLVFLIFSSVFFYILFLRPFSKTIEAKNWDKITCSIISSQLRTHNDTDDNTNTYIIDIFYSYKYKGKTHKSNRYSFLGGSSSGQKGKYRIINRFPEGAKRPCYVNPEDPFEAVLEPKVTGDMIILGTISSVFLIIGILLVARHLRYSECKIVK